MRFMLTMNPSKREISKLPVDTEVSFFPMEAVGENGELSYDQTRAIEDVSSGYTYFGENDVAFAKITPCFENGKGAIMRNLVCGCGFGTTELTVLRCSNRLDPEFLFHVTKSNLFRQNGEAWMYGAGGQKRVPDEYVKNLRFSLPPLSEQKAIATFLDRETKRIDGLIRKREKLIVLLQEKRAALISHAVTKGLNPSAKMKPSGIDWLGDIPAHWNIWKIGHGYLETGSGTTPPSDSDDWYDGAINWVTTSELREKPIFESSKKISESALETFSALRLFPKGTLLIAMYGATIGRLGTLETEATTNQACCALVKSNVFRNQFVFYWFQSFKNIVVLLASGGGQPNISQDKIRSLEVAIPSFGEQDEITSYLDVETKKIEGLMEREQQIIERMKEYRSALISAAVTGKIDVSTEQKETSVPSVPSVDRICPQKTRKAQKEEK